MSEIAGGIGVMRTGGDVTAVLEGSKGLVRDSRKEFEPAKGGSFPIPVKAVGYGKESTGDKGPGVLNIPSLEERRLG